jgi:hypothetical protein
MLRSLNDITNSYKLHALDGEIGKVKDFLFNDIFWNIRYLVADTGSWLKKRLILISPTALEQPDWETGTLPVNLSKEKIEQSPTIDQDMPVSMQNEADLSVYFTWPLHYAYGIEAAQYAEMHLMASRLQQAESDEQKRKNSLGNMDEQDPHLRSIQEVTGYAIEATDGSIGKVDDFILDDENWILRYLVVDTKKWLPGKKVLISPEWIKTVDWADSHVAVVLTREAVKDCPEFDPTEPINRNYEVKLYDYYGRPTYWEPKK